MKNNAKLGNGHKQNLNSVFESTVTEFIKLWKNGQEAALNANCKNGRAWLNLSTYLGYYGHDENESLFPEDVPKRFKTKSSPSKLRRNKERAKIYKEKKRQEATTKSVSHLETNQSKVSSHFGVVDSNSDLLQISKNCENVCHDLTVTESTIVNHNGSISGNFNNADVSDKLDNVELSVNEVIQQISSTPAPEKAKETSWLSNPDSPQTIPNSETNQPMINNLIQIEKDRYMQERRPLMINLWNEKLLQQDTEWRIKCEDSPIILDPYCVEFFRQAKMEMNDDELFNSWFEDQKRNEQYEFHNIYRRLKL